MVGWNQWVSDLVKKNSWWKFCFPSSHFLLLMNHCLNGYWGRSISYSLKITGIRTLKFLPAPFEKRNPEGLFFVDTFEKFVGSNFDRLLWRKKSEPPCSKTCNPHWGVGGGGGHKKWNVPWKRKRCLTNLEVLFAEAVLEDVLGLGREKPVAEPPLRNELVEVADPCTPTVPDVDVSSSKPSTKLYSRCSFSIEKDSVVVLWVPRLCL